jgi:transcriptional regulator with XRE-family HTH domain
VSRIIASMATTRIGQRRRAHLYVAEWMEHRGLSDEKLGNRLGVARETIWRWRTQQNRLNPDKIAGLASALEIEPEDLFRPPERVSLDAIVKDYPDELRDQAAEIVRLLGRKAS